MVNSPLYPACTIGAWTAWVNSCESISPVALGHFISDCPRLTATSIAVCRLLARNWPSVMQPAAVSAVKSIKNLAFNIGLPSKDNALQSHRAQTIRQQHLKPDTRNLKSFLAISLTRSDLLTPCNCLHPSGKKPDRPAAGRNPQRRS